MGQLKTWHVSPIPFLFLCIHIGVGCPDSSRDRFFFLSFFLCGQWLNKTRQSLCCGNARSDTPKRSCFCHHYQRLPFVVGIDVPLATLIRYHYITAKRHDIGRIPKTLRLPFGFVRVCAAMQKEAHMTPPLVSCPTQQRRCETKRLLYTSCQSKLEPTVMQSPHRGRSMTAQGGGKSVWRPAYLSKVKITRSQWRDDTLLRMWTKHWPEEIKRRHVSFLHCCVCDHNTMVYSYFHISCVSPVWFPPQCIAKVQPVEVTNHKKTKKQSSWQRKMLVLGLFFPQTDETREYSGHQMSFHPFSFKLTRFPQRSEKHLKRAQKHFLQISFCFSFSEYRHFHHRFPMQGSKSRIKIPEMETGLLLPVFYRVRPNFSLEEPNERNH